MGVIGSPECRVVSILGTPTKPDVVEGKVTIELLEHGKFRYEYDLDKEKAHKMLIAFCAVCTELIRLAEDDRKK